MKQIRQLAIALAMFAAASGLSGCAASMDLELAAHLEAERDFHAHQKHVESIYNLDLYDPEHVDDCFYYEELVCEFE